MSRLIKKIISGGQTGVDRAALDVALELNIPCTGWVPKGRISEDGPIAPKYPMKETETSDYERRTELNVKDSDATLVFTHGKPIGGTLYTIEMIKCYKKPCLIIDFEICSNPEAVLKIKEWLCKTKPSILNVAGPRASKLKGAYSKVKRILKKVLTRQ